MASPTLTPREFIVIVPTPDEFPAGQPQVVAVLAQRRSDQPLVQQMQQERRERRDDLMADGDDEATGTIEIDVRARRGSKPHCSCCGKIAPGCDVLPTRRFEFTPIWGYAVPLLYGMRRVQCRRCGIGCMTPHGVHDGLAADIRVQRHPAGHARRRIPGQPQPIKEQGAPAAAHARRRRDQLAT